MVNRPQTTVESNFIGGLKTEFTALNFPENACVAATNTVFSIIGEADRRGGINYELNYQNNVLQSPTNLAQNTYKWNNVGGDGQTQIVVQQLGGTLYFYRSSSATINSPLSHQRLVSTVNIASFVAAGNSFDSTTECQFTDGNGYLFVFHPTCDSFSCTYNAGTITATIITLQTRDFAGVPEPGVAFNNRPTSLTQEHQYNLFNQGWGLGGWTAYSATSQTIVATGTLTFTVTSAFGPPVPPASAIAVGQLITIQTTNHANIYMTGTVTSYNGTTLVVAISADSGSGTFSAWVINPSPNYLNVWFNTSPSAKSGTVGNNYPSNADVWWTFRDTNVTNNNPDGTFKPSATGSYVVLNNAQAPQGAVILNPFIQTRSTATGVSGITDVTTIHRPSTGAFFQGRVFYSGVNDSFQASGDMPYFTWTETIYFSPIITTITDFGKCYQINDPTSDRLFNLLPSDGGVINIQGCGAIYKLFPLKFGLLVFAANGIWFIGGGSGIGFTANSYTITKISNVQSISGTSVVNVLGWPVFWNEEGIYEVKPAQNPGSSRSPDMSLDVNNLCLGTILSFYQDIPLQSKKFARGDYDPTTFVIQWIYRSTNETNVTSRYQFDSALNINTYKGPFYPYSFTVANGIPYISGINYVAGPGGSTSPSPIFKYLTVVSGSNFTFSEENDFTNWKDWSSTDYVSTFTTGYKIHGQAQRQFGVEYIYVFSNNNGPTQYNIQSLWDFATSGNSGKWSGPQVIKNNLPNFGTVFRRIRLRGHGIAVQFKFTSISGQPFSFIGWSVLENQSGSV